MLSTPPHGLLDALFVVAAACILVAQIMIVRAVLRSLPVTHAPGSVPVRRSSELAWTVLPAVGLALSLIVVWRAMHGGQP